MKSNRGRPQHSPKTGPSYALAEWLNTNLAELSGMTNADIAAELGYERGNIVAMWKTGATRVPMHTLPGICQITNMPLETLFPLWVEQYTHEKGLDDQPYTNMLERIVSPAEYDLIRGIRDGGYDLSQMTDDHRKILALMLIGPEGRAELFS